MSPRRLPEKLYRIGEVMEHTGLTRQTLHFYATLGLISEKRRTPSGYRLFPATVFRPGPDPAADPRDPRETEDHAALGRECHTHDRQKQGQCVLLHNGGLAGPRTGGPHAAGPPQHAFGGRP